MKRVIELTPINLSDDQRWKHEAYPGPGAYILPSGHIVIIYKIVAGGGLFNTMAVQFDPGNIDHRASETATAQIVDIHKLLDQLRDLGVGTTPAGRTP